MREIFKRIDKIAFEGKKSRNPMAFKYYNPEEIVGDKPMREHLRFAMSYWHTLTGDGTDPFGQGTLQRPWNELENDIEIAKARVEVGFELMEKLGISYFCFHDRDVVSEAATLEETNERLDIITEYIEELMKKTKIKLLWGTSNAFSHPRFMHGAATSCSADVFAFAGAQVKKAMDITHRLKGENYVLWGGREGYETLLNTNMDLELDNLAKFLKMVVDYKKKIGFEGQLLIEPKPKEPTKHQYDFDVATVIAFLRKHGLEEDFKINIEANHATLAGHTFQHELHTARINNMLGSIDANQGDLLLGWDTDQFPTNIYDATLAMYEVLKNGGLTLGGLNFDAKVRRTSFEVEDLLYAYIAGMDTFAKGLKVAFRLFEDRVLEEFIEKRYSSYKTGIGEKIVQGKVGLEELYDYALKLNEIKLQSGRQEMLEAILNSYILEMD
ncbi:D-xylose isomerase [Anaerovirgula multivorans]|uniref:Xylose isomerase n=1 Tax=Anaerovirgula multivorans TaxID=312168 RepID=A0A239G0Q6_9FIRM|nr:xylose isomerase [Anaerovirgula multivorans]SNS62877.1 D-xylose isomerase [Anaerovirgula multivorans]